MTGGEPSHPRFFSSLPDQARLIWAKSASDDDPVRGHGLLAHMLDVAAVAERILQREPPSTLDWICQSLGVDRSGPPAAERQLAWHVGLHDFGKATIGFQAKWPEGRERISAAGLPFTHRLLAADRHDLSSALLLPARMNRDLACAVAAHHGFHFLPAELRRSPIVAEPQSWGDARAVLSAAYDGTLLAGSNIPRLSADRLAPWNWLAGLTSVADWIGSNTDWFPLGERADELALHHARALDLAERALQAIGWPAASTLLPTDSESRSDTGALLRSIIGDRSATPRPLQLEGDRLLAGCSAPALMIVEAPMGEGKTELAFIACLRLQRALGHRGLYVGLPTQATGNAMFDRMLGFLRAFSAGRQFDLQLVHGAAMLDERLVELRDVYGSGDHDAVACSVWFSQKRRALLSPYGAGTIDQALYGTLNVKHHFVRLWGLSNRVVVLDEVHAYDSYTGGLMESLLRWLKAMRCSVILMSATLPASRRRALVDAWGADGARLPSCEYPRLTMCSGESIDTAHCPSRSMPSIKVSGIAAEVDAIVERARLELAIGGCIAVIVNTVDRAQAIFRALQSDAPADTDLLLFHARFPADQRATIERAVLHRFGKHGERPVRALMVATQVAEQSLDLDFDLMISDLAPIDLLLQRAGRLHRHQRVRPAGRHEARLVVAGLLPDRLPDLEGTAWGYVYSKWVLGRTWAFSSREHRGEQEWTLPGDIDRLVQRVYGDADLPDDLPADARQFIETVAYGEFRSEESVMRMFAENASVDAGADLRQAYASKPRGREAGEGLGAENRTRFGSDGVAAVPVHVEAGGWCLEPGGPPLDPDRRPEPALARRLLQRHVKLNRKALIQALSTDEVPAGWQAHPLLRDLHVLPLTDGRCTLGRLRVELDPQLGIVYTTAAEPGGTPGETAAREPV